MLSTDDAFAAASVERRSSLPAHSPTSSPNLLHSSPLRKPSTRPRFLSRLTLSRHLFRRASHPPPPPPPQHLSGCGFCPACAAALSSTTGAAISPAACVHGDADDAQIAVRPRGPRWEEAVFVWNEDSSVETWASIRGSVERVVPMLHMSEFGGEQAWAVDMFVLPHNALRAECLDLLDILNSFARARLSLTLGMLHDMAAWWEVFDPFLTAYFALEDAVLLPWAYHTEDAASPVAELARAMAARRARVERLKEELSNAFVLFRCKPSGEVLPLVYRTVHALLPRLVSYMAKEEQQVARIVAPERPGERAEMERRIFEGMAQGPAGMRHVYLLTRWDGGNHPRVAELLRANVKGVARVRLHAQAKYVESTHLRLAEIARESFVDRPRWSVGGKEGEGGDGRGANG